DICYSTYPQHLVLHPGAYLICVDGISAGVFENIPQQYGALPVIDYSEQLIIPGLSDLHVHAPQYTYRGLGMDMELLEWLDTYAFPEESKYQNMIYAEKAYSMFVHDLKYSATTRFCAFATIHTPATLKLMQMLEKSGLRGYVGKVNMDRNSPDYYIEESADASLEATVHWAEQASELCRYVKPIVTPRFTPSCSDELMEKLGELADRKGLRVQSHLSENQDEIRWVQELCPWSDGYIDTYQRSGLISVGRPSLMAHCVYSDERELQVMKANDVFAVHCPQCNMNIASGMALVRRWLDMGMNMGLGTDVAGGATLSIFRTMMEARQVSKMVWRLMDQSLKPLTLEEIFWMGTKGGGSFFDNVGSFEPGYEVDALVLDETRMHHPQELDVRQRLERYICLSESQDIQHKFVAGNCIF
ncbi:MAG: amidohydrolase family protein, partial [Coprococcus sp.]